MYLGAASLLQSRLSAETVKKHCQHCLWCVYLAALICWNYEYATTRAMPAFHHIVDGKVASAEAVQDQCQLYLRAATQFHNTAALPTTIGTLVIITQYLESCFNIGMIQEGTELLKRITGLRGSG